MTKAYKTSHSAYGVLAILTVETQLLYDQSMATIFYVKAKKKWVYEHKVNSKVVRSYHNTREEAEALKPQTLLPTIKTFSQAIEQHLNNANVRESSMRRYRQETDSLRQTLVGDSMTEANIHLTVSKINKMFPISKSHRIIKRLITVCKIAGVPVPYGIVPKITRARGVALTPEQTLKLIELNNGNHYQPLLLFLLDTGCRLGEALGLTWADYVAPKVHINKAYNDQLKGSKLVPVKTSRGNRSITLSDHLIAILDRLKGSPKSPIFTSPLGFRVARNNLRRWWCPLIKRFKIPLRIHDLRHTCATHLLGSTSDLRMVSARMGHSNATTTLKIYDHYVLDDSVTKKYSVLTILSKRKKA